MLTSDAHDLHGINFEEGYIAVVDKPLRWTSADVVRKVKFTLRKLGYRRIKVGHAGTLDPLATGILLVCIGRATKMADALQAEEKEYVADVMLGATTPSYDLEHEIDATYPWEHITREAVEEALMAFPGTFLAVSHDRYFLDKVANCTLELENGKLTEYLGNYSYYLMKKEVAEEEAREEREALEAAEREQQAKAKHEAEARRKAAAQEEKTDDEVKKAAERRAEEKKRAELGRIQSMSDAKREEMVQRAEAEIAMAEAELKGLEFQMNNPAVQADPQQSQAIAEAYAAKEKEIEMRYEKWERLTEA